MQPHESARRAGGHRVIQLAVYVLLATYIASTLRDAPAGLYAAKWLVLATLAGIALLVGADRIQLAGTPVVLAFAPWFLLALAYQLYLGPTGRGLGVAGGYMGLLLVCFVLLPSALPTLHDLDRFERWVIHAFAAMCLLSVLLGLQQLGMSIVGGSTGRFRLRWAFEHVNEGGYLGYIGIILTVRQLAQRRWRFAVPLLLFVFMLLSSGSRGAMLALGAAFGVVALLWSVDRYGAGLVVAFSVALGTLAAALSLMTLGVQSGGASFHTLNMAMTGRLGAWRAALSRLDSPVEWLLGQGAGQNVNFIGTRSQVGGSSDSFVIDLITRSGLLGLAIWVGTIAVVILMLGRRVVELPGGAPNRAHLGFAAGLCASALVAAAYEGFIFSVGTAYALAVWSCVGVAAMHVSTRPLPERI